jgi:UDP-N-acetyl-D-mannosaminuronate dehydrogenase
LKVIDVIEAFQLHGVVGMHDPWADPAEAHHVTLLTGRAQPGDYDAIIITSGQRTYKRMGMKPSGRWANLVYVKGIFPKDSCEGRL